ncbi:flagellar hook-basal body complex protein [Trichococcus collinsii]|uniref:Flagellar hook protein FlgE n=1 Tax=Trichococcus collinsii TaxID=157076 RepID=A0AB38A0J2_9LACT|nr:flagellar hook-basal body complex protein [Trichococcus collinsii]CZQ90251.1 flagella basal body rod proteins signature [Trichococcus collinsii]SEA50939.1 flagellar hook protein FlgE [Trichococcus collinsii]
MLKSLYSGVTGMKNLQTKMDVISNNIANVNTTGFKSGRVRFEDMISQSMASAQEGVNAKQVGLGVQTSAIDTIMNGGSLQATGRELDFGIENGDSSFFVVSGDGGVNNYYTRDGGFYLDAENNLVTSAGYSVMGVNNTEPDGAETLEKLSVPAYIQVNADGSITASDSIPDGATNVFGLKSHSVDSKGVITGNYGNGESYVIGQVALAKFANAAGLEKSGGNLYVESANSGAPELGFPADDGYGVIRSGFLEMSNVDLANEFTEMIIANRAYQANSRSITTSDSMLEELLALKR